MMFRDRGHAGFSLAKELNAYRGDPTVVTLALPRGGVVVGYEISRTLHLPLDVFITRKLSTLDNPEYAIGAVSETGAIYLNSEAVDAFHLSHEDLEDLIQAQRREIARRQTLYRQGRSVPVLADRTVILVDDGLASGAEMQAAVMALRLLQPARLIVAVPVLPVPVSEMWLQEADACVSVIAPTIRDSAGHWYADLPQTTDREVQALLQQALGINPTGFDATRAL